MGQHASRLGKCEIAPILFPRQICGYSQLEVGLQSMKHTLFYVMAVLILAGTAVAGDMLVGQINDVSEIRRDAAKFREEAANLHLSTKSLVPKIDHLYFDALADSNGRVLKQIRRFRTDNERICCFWRKERSGCSEELFSSVAQQLNATK